MISCLFRRMLCSASVLPPVWPPLMWSQGSHSSTCSIVTDCHNLSFLWNVAMTNAHHTLHEDCCGRSIRLLELC